DFNWWLRLGMMGAVGRVNGPTQGLYRVHDRSLQRSVGDIELTDLRARVDAVDLFLQECAQQFSDPDRIRRIAFSSLAREARMQAARFVSNNAKSLTAYAEIADRLDE